MKTYVEMYQNEQRALELEMRDENDLPYTPSIVYFKVVDSKGNIVQEEETCLILQNSAIALITPLTTANVGDYEVIWRILRNVTGQTTYTYFHKTQVVVEEL